MRPPGLSPKSRNVKSQTVWIKHFSPPKYPRTLPSLQAALATMTDATFLETAFVPAYPVLYDEGETEGFAYGK